MAAQPPGRADIGEETQHIARTRLDSLDDGVFAGNAGDVDSEFIDGGFRGRCPG